MKILISAGEASGDRYAADLVRSLREALPQARFFGCGGPHLRETGVDAVVRTEELAVVGLFEVIRHVPRIYGLYRRLDSVARRERPDLAILTDAPDFHLRLAERLRRMGVPVVYYVAPQVWAWRKWRVRAIRRLVDQLLVIFPFEEEYFRSRGVEARFVGHPLIDLARTQVSADEYRQQLGFDAAKPTVALLPGSRQGEALRHFPALQDAAARLLAEGVDQLVMPTAATTGAAFVKAHWKGPPLRILEGQTAEAIAYAEVALVASGTATVETAILGTPMVTYYKLAWPSYYLARLLVALPFYSMVNLLAGERVVPELIQQDCTGAKLASEAVRLLEKEQDRCRMIEQLTRVRATLLSEVPASTCAANAICQRFGLRAS